LDPVKVSAQFKAGTLKHRIAFENSVAEKCFRIEDGTYEVSLTVEVRRGLPLSLCLKWIKMDTAIELSHVETDVIQELGAPEICLALNAGGDKRYFPVETDGIPLLTGGEFGTENKGSVGENPIKAGVLFEL
jgi:hypothetical protein